MIRLSIKPRWGDFQPFIQLNDEGQGKIGYTTMKPRFKQIRPFIATNEQGESVVGCTSYEEDCTYTTHLSEFKLPTKRTMQKTSLALGKLAIFALV